MPRPASFPSRKTKRSLSGKNAGSSAVVPAGYWMGSSRNWLVARLKALQPAVGREEDSAVVHSPMPAIRQVHWERPPDCATPRPAPRDAADVLRAKNPTAEESGDQNG